jgi:predicted house-cleaning noncanonical NTP pyrophosphatase (MazG superfamily)
MTPKLVRDKIPDLIRADGKVPETEVVTDQFDLGDWLSRKLQEEVDEYKFTGNWAELVDIYEVVLALWELDTRSLVKPVGTIAVEADRAREERGGLTAGVILRGITRPPGHKLDPDELEY